MFVVFLKVNTCFFLNFSFFISSLTVRIDVGVVPTLFSSGACKLHAVRTVFYSVRQENVEMVFVCNPQYYDRPGESYTFTRFCLVFILINKCLTLQEESAGFEMEPLPHSDLRIDLLMPKVTTAIA